MRYAQARYNQHQRDLAYRIFVSEGLRILTENTAKMAQGAYLTVNFLDIIDPKPKDERSGAEIASDVLTRAGIEVRFN